MIKTLLLAAAAITLAAPALAQVTSPSAAPPASPPSAAAPAVTQADKPATFSSIDTDKSGGLSLAEVKMVDISVTQADFDKYDADKSKTLSLAEFNKWQAAEKAAKPAHAG